MNDGYVVEQLVRKMGDKEPFGLEWLEHPNGGFVTEIKGIQIYISGGELSPIILQFSKGLLPPHTVREPALPRSWILKLKTRLRLGSESDKTKSALRQNLETLYQRVSQQVFKRYQDPGYQEKVKNEIYEQLIGKF